MFLSSKQSGTKSTPMDLVLGKLEKVSRSGTEWKACCPAHEDSSPSLTIRQKDGAIVLKCHAGCKQLDILHALELEWKDLFPQYDYSLWNMVFKRFIQCAQLSPCEVPCRL